MAHRIDEAEVRHISHLARLKPDEAEAQLFAEQLSAILTYVDQLNEVDTENVPPTAHPLPVSNIFRDDAPHQSFTPDQALANAPQRDGSFFVVPKVLDQESA